MTTGAARTRKARARAKPSVLLLAMPWQWLSTPSIQLGLLHSVLERAEIRSEVRTLALDFMEHCRAETAALPEAERLTPRDYSAVATEYECMGLGDWIFAVPPFRDDPESDARYLSGLRTRGVPEPAIAKAVTMRRLVPAFLARAADEVLAAGPRVVGFTTTFGQNVPSLVLARILAGRDPSLAIVFGGTNCDGPMGAALHRAFPWVDVVVRGEAERILPELMSDLVAGRPIRPRPGLCYREDGRSIAVAQSASSDVVMDEIPLPNFDEYFERLAKTGFAEEVALDVRLLYESARGCWWGAILHCTFCGVNGTSMAFRSKSPDRVVEEVTTLARRHGVLDFDVVDNIIDLDYLRTVLPRLKALGYGMTFFYETKANLRKEQVRLLRDAGATRIQPGLESLSTPILKLMRKGVTALQNVRLLKWCAELGVRVSWNVLHGFPGEPAEEYARMAALVPSLVHLEPPHDNPITLQRFSPYHSRPAEFGLQIVGPRWWYQHVYPIDEPTLMDLAYSFEHRHADGRDPREYVAPLSHAIAAWRAGWPGGFRSLRYRRGPGFLVVHDRRPGLPRADYTFGETQARVYAACEDGATVAEVCAALGEGAEADDVAQFLERLVTLRLAYEERGRYLALALPADLPEIGGLEPR
jgi:ribosomal peptide maturation radical SAM protein 1